MTLSGKFLGNKLHGILNAICLTARPIQEEAFEQAIMRFNHDGNYPYADRLHYFRRSLFGIPDTAAKLNPHQAEVLTANLRKEFEKWKEDRLNVRARHVEGVLSATDWKQVQLRQAGVNHIDQEIARRNNWLTATLDTIQRQTDGPNPQKES